MLQHTVTSALDEDSHKIKKTNLTNSEENMVRLCSLTAIKIQNIWHIFYCNIHSAKQNVLRGPTDALGFMNVILLHSDQRHVSDTHVGD